MQPAERGNNYERSDCVSAPEVYTRFSPGVSQDGMFNPMLPDVDTPASNMTPAPPRRNRAPILSFNRRISEEGASMHGPASASEWASTDRLPQVNTLAASHGGGGSRRTLHPIISVRRRQAELSGGMQAQLLQQAMSSPIQAVNPGPSAGSQFRLSLPSLAPRAAFDQRSIAAQSTDSEQLPQNRFLNMGLSTSQARSQAPSLSTIMLAPLTHSKPTSASATPGYPSLKPATMNQVPAVPEDSLFLATPLTAPTRRAALACEPPATAKHATARKALPMPMDRTKSHELQEQQQQQQQQQQRPAAANPKDDTDPHYELDPEFEIEAAKQRRMSSGVYIKTPAGQEKALGGPAALTTDAVQRPPPEEDEYEEEQNNWEPKESLLLWLEANVQNMKKKGRVA